MKKSSVVALCCALIVSGFCFAEDAKKAAKTDFSKLKMTAKIGEGKLRGLHAVTVDKDGNVYALTASGNPRQGNVKSSITKFDKDGKLVKTMKDVADMVTALTVDDSGNIYLATIVRDKSKDRKVKRGRREYTYPGYSAKILKLDAEGKVAAGVDAPELSNPTGMEYYDGSLIISDYLLRSVVKVDPATGKIDPKFGTKGKITGFRPCCGILDCSVDRKTGKIYVGNLGGFRVDVFDKTGKRVTKFGKRSGDKKDFCGCCNPVSVSAVSGGLVATTEKTNPRVKVYDLKGKMLGIVDLAQVARGCGRMDIVAAPNNVIYAVNMRSGVIMKFEAK